MTDTSRSTDDTILTVPALLLVLLAVAAGIGIIITAGVSSAAYAPSNPTWQGTSDLRSVTDSAGIQTTIATSTEEYPRGGAANGTLAVVVAPASSYDEGDVARLSRFVRDGGTLVVAAERSDTNDLLASLGVQSRLDGRPLRDEQNNYRSPSLVEATPATNYSYVADMDTLTLNHGTAIEASDAQVLVNTSDFGYLDVNADGTLNASDPVASYPVVTLERIGQGRVVVVSDPSVFVNGMLRRPGNEQFVANLADTHDRALFDHSHSRGLAPLYVGLLVLRRSPLIQGVLALALVSVIGGWYYRPSIYEWARDRRSSRDGPPAPGLSDAELRESLLSRHPEWDEERAQRVIRSMRDRDSSQSDE